MINFKNTIIIEFSEVLKHDNVNIKSLVEQTVNTWQPHRTMMEKTADTQLGKFAEDCIITALEKNGIDNYHSYDSFRNDNLKYHAPFDGIISNNLTNDIINLINEAVVKEGSKLSFQTREKIRKTNSYTVEIKSTRLSQKYKAKAVFNDYNDEIQLGRLIDNLNNLDFLAYPYFTRYGDMTFEQYCYNVETKFLHSGLRGAELREHIKEIELNNASDIYIRIFIDEVCKKAIIMGWIDRNTFFKQPETSKLILPGKSEIPLYFVSKIKNGKPLFNLKDVL